MRAAGTELQFCAPGYGKYASQQDSRFAANAEGALAAGVACGAYWFSYALTPDDAREEAQLCAQVLGPYRGRFSFPVWYDYEYDSERYSEEHGVSPNKELRTQLAVAFCAEMERLGWRAGGLYKPRLHQKPAGPVPADRMGAVACRLHRRPRRRMRDAADGFDGPHRRGRRERGYG